MHCADLLTWAHQNALKKVIESSHDNTFFILTTSHASALQAAILSRGVVIRCPLPKCAPSLPFPPVPFSHTLPAPLSSLILSCVAKVLTPTPLAATANKSAREAACALSKLYSVSTAPMFLRCFLESVLNHLRCSRDVSDSEQQDVVQDVMNVDQQICICRSSSKGLGSTLTIALHRALLLTCTRLYK